METVVSITAFVGTSYVGTAKLGRPLTKAESRQLSALLREHDFVGASLVALRFALVKTRNKAAAQDLQSRAQQRLVQHGWDPSKVTLTKCLCRLVWSEHMNERRERATRRRAEQSFLGTHGLSHSPSPEDLATRLATEQEEEAYATQKLDALRAAFTEAGDEVNLLWLDYRLDGVDEPADMARLSGRDVSEFYRATDRRNRHVARLAAEGGPNDEELK